MEQNLCCSGSSPLRLPENLLRFKFGLSKDNLAHNRNSWGYSTENLFLVLLTGSGLSVGLSVSIFSVETVGREIDW